MHAQFGTLTLRNIAINIIKLRWSNDWQLGMPATDTIILAASQICSKLSPGLHYNNVDSKQNLLCFTRLFTISHTCEPSGGGIFLPILRVSSVPPVNFQNLLPVIKNQVPKNLDLHFAINISRNSLFGTPALTKNAERYEW